MIQQKLISDIILHLQFYLQQFFKKIYLDWFKHQLLHLNSSSVIYVLF